MVQWISFLFQLEDYNILTLYKFLIQRTCIILCMVLCAFQLQAQDDIVIKFDETTHMVSVIGSNQFILDRLASRGLDNREWQNIFSIYVVDKDSNRPINNLPILGKYNILNQTITFIPRFPFDQGLSYIAKFNTTYLYAMLEMVIPDPISQKIISDTFEIKKETNDPLTTLELVYPSADTIPVNQLRVYLHFSQPIIPGHIYDHVYLVNERGQEIKDAFLRLDPELWDNENRRVTLWLDPGRIKRALSPNIAKGLPLQPNKHYKLVVTSGLIDSNGNKTTKQFLKDYFVMIADREKPNPKNWQLQIPGKLNAMDLKLFIDEPLDEALLQTMIWIEDHEGQRISGQVKIQNNGKNWTFTPDQNWQLTSYYLVINSKLEDLAGNSLRRLFDQEVLSSSKNVTRPTLLYIPFSINKSSRQKKIRKWDSRTFNQ